MDLTIRILERYRSKEKTFKINNAFMSIHPNDVALIFGVINGDRPIELTYTSKSNIDIDIVRRRLVGDKDIKLIKLIKLRKEIKVAVKSDLDDDVQDVVRMICLVLIGTFFFESRSERVKWGFLKYIEDINTMREYAWDQAIIQDLMGSIGKANGDPSKVAGYTSLLQVTLHTCLCLH